ncbi:hypothetical protein [Alteromonas sp. a30]|uniref:hypothetical protein n=1 Tax=Alteromonas sp. a30 TaxID=2730917 RepID=UPI0022832899|nr:hypothetical protein [Alteromonas sp. a30]MCY7295028.1 hypothetical protein [Alteromonas sp. a30]
MFTSLKTLFTTSLLILMLASCGGGGDSTQPVQPPPPPPPAPTQQEQISELWSSVIPNYMEQVPWASNNIYDAGHVLMLPLDYAFSPNGSVQMQNDFHALFSDYLAVFDESIEPNILSRFQFLYLATRYLNLVQPNGFNQEQKALYDKILSHLELVFFEQSARYAFNNIGTLEEVVQTKLDLVTEPVSKLRRVTVDLEFHVFAIAGEFAAMQRRIDGDVSQRIQRILDLSYDTFQSEVVYTDSGWLYQPGFWENYVDYQFAGHSIIQENLAPLPVAGIATDSSHSHRMPLWLLSMAKAYPEGNDRREYFESLSDGFEEQFMTVVYRAPTSDFPAPRMTNYMDGHNGLYRYNADNPEPIKLAYEAFNLSGTLLISFFPYMYNDELASAYENLAFPLQENVADLYVGLGPSLDPTASAITLPAYHENGFAEMNALIASLMVSEVVQ